jgi:hypothetical protein
MKMEDRGEAERPFLREIGSNLPLDDHEHTAQPNPKVVFELEQTAGMDSKGLMSSS